MVNCNHSKAIINKVRLVAFWLKKVLFVNLLF